MRYRLDTYVRRKDAEAAASKMRRHYERHGFRLEVERVIYERTVWTPFEKILKDVRFDLVSYPAQEDR